MLDFVIKYFGLLERYSAPWDGGVLRLSACNEAGGRDSPRRATSFLVRSKRTLLRRRAHIPASALSETRIVCNRRAL